ncbi:hypothetical protein D1816_25360 [Aquimarina sp. AD10]|uniref:Uncharacterized protein n=1 Tax=Aquimarina aggregata TaxID=1642818 RepID=A0A163BU82_9FLAO|nr:MULTISPECIES: hypothetical protein [Aquimarina]AXT63530.1 hypothetical protein D1816_25360 [Aquimarina sp. AD10]KZS41780.1 hypothetical protein AWE51_20515 [Aquimarina aggregata]RKM99752.1 hypothetical protein D7033_11335 [Aquimarina sp. AD10]
MKPTIIALLLLTTYTCFGQSRKSALSDIRNKYQLIRELLDSNALRQHHTDYSCKETSEEGTLTFYYNSSELKHISHNYTKGHVNYRDEFYIWDDELFFQYSIHNIWYKDYERNKSGKLEKVDVTLTLEERFYFENNAIIKCQFKDYENRSNTPKIIKTQHIRNKNVGCDQAQDALEKFNTLLQYQEINIKDACNLPRSITKTEIIDIINNSRN